MNFMADVPTFADVFKVAPILCLLIAAIFPITVKVLNNNKEQPRSMSLVEGLLGIGLALFWVGQSTLGTTAFAQAVNLDGLAYWSNVIVLILAGLTLFLSYGNTSTSSQQFSEHIFLLLASVIGMLVIAWANDLILAFIGIEVMSLAFYVLAGLSYEQKYSKEAAFKYFILGSFGSAILLYGVALIYGALGSTSITVLSQQGFGLFTQDPLFAIGVLLFCIGLFFKVSIFPFHAWSPDVYQGSPTPVTAFMSTAGKLAAFVLLIRVVGADILAGSKASLDIMQWLAVMTMLVGNFLALRQDNLKRMLAFSGVAHSGYAFCGVVAISTGASTGYGASAVLYYFLAYGLMNIVAFGMVSLFERIEGQSVLVDDLRGLAKKSPWLAAALTIALLSLAGLPPTAGFFGKFYVFSAAVKQGLLWLTVWGVINSVLGVYYYLRPVVNMYMKDADESAEAPRPDTLAKVAMIGSSVAILAIGLFADGLITRLGMTVTRLFN